VINYLATVRVFDGEVECLLVNRSSFYAPALRRIREGFLQFDELLQIVIVERVRLPEAPTGVELVVPNLPCRCALIEEKHHRLDAQLDARAATKEQTVRGYNVKVKYNTVNEAEKKARKKVIAETVLQALRKMNSAEKKD
jgi:hypothetical protein